MTSERRRTYDSTRRRGAADDTRESILNSALALFAARGYANATVAEVATRAGVSLRTVYSSVGGKAELLAAIIARAEAESGGEEAIERVKELRDPAAVLAALASGTRAGNEQSQAIFELARSTASMPEGAGVRTRLTGHYSELLDVAAHHLADLHALPAALSSAEAGEILWFCFGIDAWTTVTRDLDKSWEEAERWLLARATALLLS